MVKEDGKGLAIYRGDELLGGQGHGDDWLTLSKRENQRLARHLVDVQTFPEPILYMAGIDKRNAFENIVVAGNYKDMSFIVKRSNDGSFGIEGHAVILGSSRIGDRVCGSKGQESSQARPSTKRKINLPTPLTRTTRQKVTMLLAKPSKGKVVALETLEVFDDEQDLTCMDDMSGSLPMRAIKQSYELTGKAKNIMVSVDGVLHRAWLPIIPLLPSFGPKKEGRGKVFGLDVGVFKKNDGGRVSRKLKKKIK
nr:hypothetical protein [Tanacetum cinerariifolium]